MKTKMLLTGVLMALLCATLPNQKVSAQAECLTVPPPPYNACIGGRDIHFLPHEQNTLCGGMAMCADVHLYSLNPNIPIAECGYRIAIINSIDIEDASYYPYADYSFIPDCYWGNTQVSDYPLSHHNRSALFYF
jgi:hypothetical protein